MVTQHYSEIRRMASLHPDMMQCRLLARAIETAGSLDRVAVRDAFAAVSGYKGATTISHYDENRHPVKSLTIQTIKVGRLNTIKLWNPKHAEENSRR